VKRRPKRLGIAGRLGGGRAGSDRRCSKGYRGCDDYGEGTHRDAPCPDRLRAGRVTPRRSLIRRVRRASERYRKLSVGRLDEEPEDLTG
jgi:hypothetical protein